VPAGRRIIKSYRADTTFTGRIGRTWWKRYNFEGGVADPLVVSWPGGIHARPVEMPAQVGHPLYVP